MKEGNHLSGGGGGEADPKNVENINVCIDSQPCVLRHQLWDQLTVLEANGFPKVIMVCVEEEWLSMRYIWISLLHEYLSWSSWRLIPIFDLMYIAILKTCNALGFLVFYLQNVYEYID